MVLIELLEELGYYADEYPQADIWVNIGEPQLAQVINLVSREDDEPGFALTIESGEHDYDCASVSYIYDRCQGLVLGLPEKASYYDVDVYDIDQGFFIGTPSSVVVNERYSSSVGTWEEIILKVD